MEEDATMTKEERSHRDASGAEDPWSKEAVERAAEVARKQAEETKMTRRQTFEQIEKEIKEMKGDSVSVYGVIGHRTGQGARMYTLYQEDLGEGEFRYFSLLTGKDGEEIVKDVNIGEMRERMVSSIIR